MDSLHRPKIHVRPEPPVCWYLEVGARGYQFQGNRAG